MFNRRFLYAALISALALLFHVDTPAQSLDRSTTLKEIEALKKKFIEKEKQFLAPSAEDQAVYAEFLKQPKTGLIRLFPSGLYHDVLMINGAGSSYSFTRLSHYFDGDSHLAFRAIPKDDNPSPPDAERKLGACIRGFIVRLGDVPLKKVTLEHDGVKFLAIYDLPSTMPEVDADWRRALDGFMKNGYEYKRDAQVTENHTYALRSFNPFNGKSDVLVAFRIVRKENDGSLVIIWKMLKQFPRPLVKR
jgi:hypothetical protein